jgi:hypothetical protein
MKNLYFVKNTVKKYDIFTSKVYMNGLSIYILCNELSLTQT